AAAPAPLSAGGGARGAARPPAPARTGGTPPPPHAGGGGGAPPPAPLWAGPPRRHAQPRARRRRSGCARRHVGPLGALRPPGNDPRASRRRPARADAEGWWPPRDQQLQEDRLRWPVSAARHAPSLLLQALRARWKTRTPCRRDQAGRHQGDGGACEGPGRADGSVRSLADRGEGGLMVSRRASLVTTLMLVVAAPAMAAPPKLPPGVSTVLYELAVPAGTEPTPEKVALGDKLSNDKRLSSNDAVACATCHEPGKGFVDQKPLPDGVAAPKERPQRNSPTVVNAMFNATQFWDGRAPTLEEQ